MSEAFKRIKLACPKCGIEKSVRVPLELFNGKGFGIVKIQVPLGGVCEEHNFLVLLNKEGSVLGYETFDMLVSKTSEAGEEEAYSEKPNEQEELEQSTSNLQNYINKFGFNCIVGYLHSKLFDYPSYLICRDDVEIQIDEMELLFNAIVPETYRNSHKLNVVLFDPEIYPQPGYYYALSKNRHQDAFIINPNRHVINVPWKTNIDYEKVMLRNALGENSSETQVKKLSEYINHFIEDVDHTVSFLKSVKKVKEKDLINSLNEAHPLTTFNKPRLRLIREFISKQITPELASKIII